MQIDIDSFVNYQEEYSKDLQKATVRGTVLTALCPFHNDSNASFSVDIPSGKYHCFSCGASGNYVKYRAQRGGISMKDAYIAILKDHGKYEEQRPKAQPKASVADSDYTVEDYAAEKHLPVDFLKQKFFLSGGVGKDGGFIRLPYFNRAQEQIVFRKRFPKGAPKRFAWSNGAAGKLLLYGEWLLDSIEKEGYCVLVEGESDTQTLWQLGIPALGVPGATTYKPDWTARLANIPTLYLHIEPDSGGMTFKQQMLKKLHAGEFLGEVKTFSCGGHGYKDPSELFIAEGENAERVIRECMTAAQTVNLETVGQEEVIPGAPINLRQPEGWVYSQNGISIIEEKTQQPKCICKTPIILSKRMRNDMGEEKVEVSWYRDGEWHSECFPRSVIFQAKSITVLTDLGCCVTSENAKHIVSFLSALEAENYEALEVVDSTSHCGWQSKNRFYPGMAGDLVLDAPPSLGKLAAAYYQTGELSEWCRVMGENRRRSPYFRTILDCAFAAPLIMPLKVRNFMVYIWNDAKAGKTAALKAALSAWGDPERLMISFDSTQASLERRAGFFCDLPLGIDERQTAGDKQGFLEKIVYMLANGVGRSRAAKDGGLQETLNWRTCCIATGEEPLMQEMTKGGVFARTLELYGKPFADETDAAVMHKICADNCGWAGPKYVKWVSEHMPEVKDAFDLLLQQASERLHGKDGNHASTIACLACADYGASRALWGTSSADAITEADALVDTLVRDVQSAEPQDINDRAAGWILDWLNAQRSCFGYKDAMPSGLQYFGWLTDTEACIIPTVLRENMERSGFSYRKTMRYLTDSGIVQTAMKAGKSIPTVTKRNPAGNVQRVVVLNLDALKTLSGVDDYPLLSQEESGQLPF